MNAYILLSQTNARINDIPPRLMWNIDSDNWSSSASGYCGETSVLSSGLLYGQYVPVYLVRQLLADYFNSLWGEDPENASDQLIIMWGHYFGIGWNESGSPGGDYPGPGNVTQEWFTNNGQYYCQLLPQIWSNKEGAHNSGFKPTNAVLHNLHLAFEHFAGMEQDTKNNFIPWVKRHVVNGHPVTIGVQDFLAGSNDPDFDHIVIVIGWGSNHDLGRSDYFADDEIVFCDHGLVICGQQPHGGSIPYYFRYVMQTESSIKTTGGWLPDGGCPDPTNPAWDFILDLGTSRTMGDKNQYTCNTYQLAQSPSTQGSSGNAGFAITGLTDTLPAGVHVRIDTDSYFEVPVITTAQAKSGKRPVSTQTINHRITVTGLDAGKTYNLWLFKANNTGDIMNIPPSGFNAYGKILGLTPCVISGQATFTHACALAADVALFARCVLTTDQ